MSKPYVYVVDDDDVVRLNMVKKLSKLNCYVRAFESGEALLDHMGHQEDDPDLILLDYKMGGLNGMETLQAVRKFSQVPAVIFTAYQGWINMEEVKNIGGCEVRLKSVDLQNLCSIVMGIMAVKNINNPNRIDRGSLLL